MLLHRLKLLLAPLGWNLLRKTVSVSSPTADFSGTHESVIFACLHQDILPAMLYVRTQRPVLLISTSTDGEILIRALGRTDFGFVRGQTGAEGARALVELRRSLEAGRNIGLAVDGPKGPYGSIQPGVLQLARLTGAVVLPLRAHSSSAIILDTWDRTVVPRPFSRVDIVCGPEIRLTPESSETEMGDAHQVLAAFFGSGGRDL